MPLCYAATLSPRNQGQCGDAHQEPADPRPWWLASRHNGVRVAGGAPAARTTVTPAMYALACVSISKLFHHSRFLAWPPVLLSVTSSDSDSSLPDGAKLLKRAAEIYGEKDLAVRLGVPLIELQSWIKGVSRPPDAVIKQAIDIISDNALKDLNTRWPFTPRSKEK